MPFEDQKPKPQPLPPPPSPPAGAPPAAGRALPREVQPLPAEPRDKVPVELDRVLIREYPKVVFLYPTFLVSILCGILSATGWVSPHVLGFAFIVMFVFNLLVISFEFTRMVSVALVLFLLVLVLGGVLLNQKFGLVDAIARAFAKLDIQANSHFYFAVAIGIGLIFVGVFLDTRTDYWEIRSNEIIHHHGFLGDIERFPAPNLKFRKEITDVFEFLLLLSGRIVLYPSGSERAVVLENVPRINKVDDQIKDLLESLEVRIETKPPVEMK